MNDLVFEPKRLITLDRITLAPLVAEARETGHRHMDRLLDDWETGENRFDHPGEALFAVFDRAQLIGIGGLNRDPYAADATSGRVRRVYVLAAYRRRGVGRNLMRAIVADARGEFSRLTLRTAAPDAAAFYESIGFHKPSDVGSETTHVLVIGGAESGRATE